ncbi:hypothetical protein HYU18_00220 [Candidatus Woesearchaeota archaeon]|nr:hypothetical protein [Candidatus Woesearchaeota archaeon]
MPLPLVSAEGIARAVREYDAECRSRGDFLGLAALANEYFGLAEQNRHSGDMSSALLLQVYTSAIDMAGEARDAYLARQGTEPGLNIPGFTEGLDDLVQMASATRGYLTPSGSQHSRWSEGPEPQLQPQPRPVSRRVAVMDR